MNSNCPQCETILRNPKLCACGWQLEAIELEPLSAADIFANNQKKAKELRAFVDGLNLPYEPGSDFGVEYE